MSTMPARELKKWAQQEVAEALVEWLKERIKDPSFDFDDRQALKIQAIRVAAYMGQPATVEKLARV
jgi:hypothetical protein